jgi:hypothetical protein
MSLHMILKVSQSREWPETNITFVGFEVSMNPHMSVQVTLLDKYLSTPAYGACVFQCALVNISYM